MSNLLGNLPHVCTIFRQTRTADAFGGNKYATVTEKTLVKCWEQQASASEISEYEKRGISISNKIYFTEDPKITERHRILITKRRGVATKNLSITDVSNPDVLDVVSVSQPDVSVGLSLLWRAMCFKTTSCTQ